MRGLTLADPALVGAVALAGATFNPWSASYPTPLHAVWASDPAWTNPGDGGAVTTWRNQSGGGDPTQGTAGAKPTFRATTAAFNNQSTVQFDGGDQLLIDTTDIAQPYKLICVAQTTLTLTAQAFMGTSGGSNRIGVSAANAWFVAAGTGLAGSGSNLNAHVFQGTLNGGSSQMFVDGASVASGAAGAGAHINFALGCGSAASARLTGHIAYAAVYDGAVTNAALLTLMQALGVYYGITV